MIEFTEVIHEKHEFFFTKRESIFHSCISLLTIVTMALAVIGVFPKPQVQANNYDVVIETTIGQDDYKVFEINNMTGDVNFYEFTIDGNPVLDGNNDQTTFVPGDNDFEDRLTYLNDVIIFSSLTIASSTEFALPIFVGDGYYGDTITQVCYDGDSSTDYRVIQHNELDDPFIPASLIGTFAYMEVGETTYTGFSYTPNVPLGQWDQAAINGLNTNSTSAEVKKDVHHLPAKFKIEGTTSSGKKVKIEDKGDGKGPKVYKGEDKNGDGEIGEDEWEEVTDEEEIDEIVDEICDDIENGLGSYETEAFDADGDPCDAIITFKKSDGTYAFFKITRTGGTWNLDAKNDVSNDCMVYMGYISSKGDLNPQHAWSVGTKKFGEAYTEWSYQNFAKFNDKGEFDPNAEQRQYCYDCGASPKPIETVSQFRGRRDTSDPGTIVWPTEPCPPV